MNYIPFEATESSQWSSFFPILIESHIILIGFDWNALVLLEWNYEQTTRRTGVRNDLLIDAIFIIYCFKPIEILKVISNNRFRNLM